MIALAVALAVALVVVAVRHSRRRSAELETALHEAVARHLDGELEISERSIALSGGGYRLPRARLLAVARRQADVEAVAAAAATLLGQPLRPLSGPLSLKIHGTRVGIHLVDPLVLALTAPEPRLAGHRLPGLGLTATYRVDGRPDQCVSEDHLREQAIDTADIHGIALAVLGQRFDESLISRLALGHRVVVQSEDGSASALLLVLADFLPPAMKLEGVLEGGDRLVLQPLSPETPLSQGEGVALTIDDRGWKVL